MAYTRRRSLPVKIVWPAEPSEALRARFEAVRAEVSAAYAEQGTSRTTAHALMFPGGDYVCFVGARGEGDGGAETLRLDVILSYRCDPLAEGGWVFAKLSPGATVTRDAEGLHGADPDDPWDLPGAPDALLLCEFRG